MDDESETDDDGQPVGHVPTVIELRNEAKQAASNMQRFIEWYEKQEEAESVHTMLLSKFRSSAAKKSEASVKQSKMTEHFPYDSS